MARRSTTCHWCSSKCARQSYGRNHWVPAGVGKGTFFNYFESKNHLLAMIAEVSSDKVREALELAMAGERSIQSVLRHFFDKAQ